MDALVPVIGVGAVALVGFVVFRVVVAERERKEKRAREARLHGFHPVTPPDPATVDRIVGLHRRAGRTSLEVRELHRRDTGDRALYLFNLADTSSDGAGLVCDRAVLIVAPALRLPPFTLVPQIEQAGKLAGLANWVIQQLPISSGSRVDFPAAPAFQQRYALMAEDEDAVRRFFTPERLARLAETRYWMVAGEGDALTLDRLEIAPPGRRRGTPSLAERLRDVERAWDIFASAP